MSFKNSISPKNVTFYTCKPDDWPFNHFFQRKHEHFSITVVNLSWYVSTSFFRLCIIVSGSVIHVKRKNLWTPFPPHLPYLDAEEICYTTNPLSVTPTIITKMEQFVSMPYFCSLQLHDSWSNPWSGHIHVGKVGRC